MKIRAAALAFLTFSALSAQAAWVENFSPQELIDQQTRATAVFSSDMVSLGQPLAPAPFRVDCGAIAGSGRWIDTTSWAWQLERPLQSGERCVFTLKPGLRATNGDSVDGQRQYRFFAPGPWPRQILPSANSNIEEDQAFIIVPAGPVTLESVERNAWCEADGVGNRIPVRAVADKLRQEILVSQQREGRDEIVVSCAERLPPGARMKLVWGKGTQAANGALTLRDESFTYTVREPFRATLNCEREKASAPCSPLSNITLEFSGNVDAKLRDKIRLITPEGARSPTNPDAKGSSRESTLRSVAFAKPFAQGAELTLELPAGLQDDAGRPLANAASFPLRFKIGTLPPLAKFPGDFGIVELKEGGVLPVTLRNVEAKLKLVERHLTDDAEIIKTLRGLARFNRQSRQTTLLRDGKAEKVEDYLYARELSFLAREPGTTTRELPKPGGVNEFEVVGIPLTKPGFHVVEIESRLLGNALLSQPGPMYVRASALVTNLAVHLKRGTDNALVWVTALDSGKPMAGADVRVLDCKGKLLWSGKTDAQGRSLTDQALTQTDCEDESYLFASARLGADYSFVRSDWTDGIEPWRFGVNTWSEQSGSQIMHTIFDRTLLRPGQTVAMKHIVRDRSSRGLAFPDATKLPKRLLIRHDSSGAEYPVKLAWDAQGTATSQWKIPEAAKRGTYTLDLPGGGEFRVSDFRLPVFSGRVQGVAARYVAPKQVPLALGLNFLNGGAAKGAEVSVSATVRPTWPQWTGYDRYSFRMDFNDEALRAFGVTGGTEREELVLDKQSLKLDQAGAGKLDVALKAQPKGPAELYAEMSFNDPNGEIQTLHGSVPLWPAAVVLGISIRDWASSSEKGRVDLVALDLAGKPIANQEIIITGKRRLSHSHRRRIVGGFYAYENREEFIDLGELCRNRTGASGKLSCQPKPTDPGEILLLAETRDAQNNIARSSGSYWNGGSGEDEVWFGAGNQDRIDVIPEKKAYKPGETARLQVRTPFREATALISIEAGGIVETFVQPLSRFKPLIELPVKTEWAPNVYVSVLVVRGRVEPLKWYSFFKWGWREPIAWFRDWWNPVQPGSMVDLAKPSWRIGLAELDVGTEGMQLAVEVQPDRTTYRPRDEATVRLKVSTPGSKPVPAGTEIAFAAVDQALLELRDNDSWKLLEAMTPRRAYEVETATAQSQVIGKRHYGRKAVPPGGGGGRAPARELFDTLLSWQPRVKVGADGTAMVKVPINDSLTEFKFVGLATAGTGLFGSGSASVRTRQDLQLISGLPPVVRENDSYQALLTVRNGTAKVMNVRVTAKVGEQSLEPKEIKLDAEGAAEVSWTARAPEGISTLPWDIEVTETGGSNKDRLKISQRIEPAVPLTVQQASFARIEGKLEIPLAPPADALPGKGGIEVALSAKLAVAPPGLVRFFETYPFSCLEQKTSVAIGLHDAKRWTEIVDSLPSLLDNHGLARYFPGDGPGSVALTAYVLDMALLSATPLPAETRTRMEEALVAYVEGRFQHKLWAPGQNDALLTNKLVALEALTRSGRTTANIARAASALELNLPRLPTSSLIDAWLLAKRLPGLPERTAKLAATELELRNRLSYSGGRLAFSTEKSDYAWWLMVSGDSNAFRLIEAMLDEPGWRDELPKLLRGALERQVRGHWSTTTANAWAVVALNGYAKRFERDEVTGITRAEIGKAGKKAEQRWPISDGTRLTLPWPTAADKLTLSHEGSGKPWASLQTLAVIPITTARAFGYRVSREVTPIQESEKGKISRGDLWRVRLTVDAEQDMSWVVLSDPIPAGARILGDGDGRDSKIATQDEDLRSRRLSPSFVERSFATYRAYYEAVPRGRFSIDYTLRLNNAGEFTLPATRVEAMYAPDLFGEAPNGRVVVTP
jgi:uncharacterized protein YfaS (alpha-2-macroglobulin family)